MVIIKDGLTLATKCKTIYKEIYKTIRYCQCKHMVQNNTIIIPANHSIFAGLESHRLELMITMRLSILMEHNDWME